MVGTTPQVHTDSNLVAPFYNALWDGTGTTFSTQTFTVIIGSGTTYFVLVDALFDAMAAALDVPCYGGVSSVNTAILLSIGCTATTPHPINVAGGFSPGSYNISFNLATTNGVPEFNLSSLLAVAVALPLLTLLKNRRTWGAGRSKARDS